MNTNEYLWIPLIILVSTTLIFYLIIYFRNEKKCYKASEMALNIENAQLQVRCKKLQKDNDGLTALLETRSVELSRLRFVFERYQLNVKKTMLAQSIFLANVNHEIRTPMNGIMGFAQLLKNEESAEKRERYIDIIYNNGLMLVNLIDDIIDISKIDAGQLAITRAECNLDNLLFEGYTFFN